MIAKLPIDIPKDVIKAFCHKWKVEELSLFGSALRPDFRADSDVDILITLAKDAEWSVFDHSRMTEELSALLGRPVDIVESTDLSNPFRRHEILTTRKLIYAG